MEGHAEFNGRRLSASYEPSEYLTATPHDSYSMSLSPVPRQNRQTQSVTSPHRPLSCVNEERVPMMYLTLPTVRRKRTNSHTIMHNHNLCNEDTPKTTTAGNGKPSLCELCEDSEATWLCHACARALCERCAKVHTRLTKCSVNDLEQIFTHRDSPVFTLDVLSGRVHGAQQSALSERAAVLKGFREEAEKLMCDLNRMELDLQHLLHGHFTNQRKKIADTLKTKITETRQRYDRPLDALKYFTSVLYTFSKRSGNVAETDLERLSKQIELELGVKPKSDDAGIKLGLKVGNVTVNYSAFNPEKAAQVVIIDNDVECIAQGTTPHQLPEGELTVAAPLNHLSFKVEQMFTISNGVYEILLHKDKLWCLRDNCLEIRDFYGTIKCEIRFGIHVKAGMASTKSGMVIVANSSNGLCTFDEYGTFHSKLDDGRFLSVCSDGDIVYALVESSNIYHHTVSVNTYKQRHGQWSKSSTFEVALPEGQLSCAILWNSLFVCNSKAKSLFKIDIRTGAVVGQYSHRRHSGTAEFTFGCPQLCGTMTSYLLVADSERHQVLVADAKEFEKPSSWRQLRLNIPVDVPRAATVDNRSNIIYVAGEKETNPYVFSCSPDQTKQSDTRIPDDATLYTNTHHVVSTVV